MHDRLTLFLINDTRLLIRRGLREGRQHGAAPVFALTLGLVSRPVFRAGVPLRNELPEPELSAPPFADTRPQ